MDVEAIMIELIQCGEQLNETIESMKSALASHRPGVLQETCHHRFSSTVQESNNCTLAIGVLHQCTQIEQVSGALQQIPEMHASISLECHPHNTKTPLASSEKI